LKKFLKGKLPPAHVPQKIILRDIEISHRFKQK